MGETTIHTIFVPVGWSPEQAWEVISRGETIPEADGEWTNVEIEELTTRIASDGTDAWNEVTGGNLIAWHPVEADPDA